MNPLATINTVHIWTHLQGNKIPASARESKLNAKVNLIHLVMTGD